MFYRLKYLILVLFKFNYIICIKNKIECGYKQCPQTRDGALNVHLIPHSHMDAGWVKTFDEYYYGTKSTVSSANVQLIYHSVLSELLHDKRRKFTFSETAYFWRWWKEQRPLTRSTFRTLVQEGRIEFAGGGWVQNDEATTNYLQIIDQFTWGLRKLNDTLGPCGKPKAAWQIDTYGHTREQVSLLAQMGFDGLFIGRVDHILRQVMIEEDRMEFMWRGSDALGKMSDIMTHSLFNLYNAPEGFCFDFLCNDEPIVDDPDNREHNSDKRVNDFISQIERQAKYYDHDNIMVTMGGDFTYQSAANWYMNMDKIINYVTTHKANMSDINIFYSTPSCYLKAIYLYGRRDKAVYTEKGDLLPYGSDSQTYWTGYYSSRPSFKYLIRRAHMFLQIVKQLTVISRLADSYELHLLRHAVSLALHHDAITGTSQQHVSNDFIRTITEAIDACTKKVSSILSYLTPTWGGSRRSKNTQHFIMCHALNMSQCRFTETQESMLLLVYNPLTTKTYYHVRLPAVAHHYSIRDYNDEEVEYQLVPLPAAIINLPGRTSTAIQELCFEAENIPPMGFTAYYIAPVRDQDENEFTKRTSKGKLEVEQEVVPTISNEYLKISVDKSTGLLESFQHMDGLRIDISQNFYNYVQSQQNLQSGAYSFRPDKERPTPVTDKASYYTVRGALVKEIRQRFTDWVTQIIRLYRGEEFVELEWIVGPVPIGSDLGKEVVSLFTSNITSNGEFFTDSNGRQMMRRTCWNESALGHHQKKPVPSCYFPVTSRICIQSHNSSVGMCVMTDRTQGGTSYNDGEIELMVHRRLLTDDGFGLEEALNEEAYGAGLVVRGKHRIHFGNFKQEVEGQTFSEKISQSARRWQYEPWLFLTSGDKLNRRKWQNVRNKRFTALKLHGLPRHINVLTLEPWKAGTVLLRLENTLEDPIRERFRTENSDRPEDYISQPTHITVELRKIFLQMRIRRVRETTLAANQWLDDARQMDWSTRYVYNGADDGLLPEDAEDTEDKPQKMSADPKESYPVPTSDEELEYPRRKSNRQRRPSKSRTVFKGNPYYDRRERRDKRETDMKDILRTRGSDILTDDFIKIDENKMEVNMTADVIGSVINVTNNELNINNTSERIVDETLIEVTSESTITTEITDRLKIKNQHKISKPSLSSRKNTRKPIILDRIESEEIASSEEDFSANLKKKSRKRTGLQRKKNKVEEPLIDDSDDGITKSIYDMYYRLPYRSRSSEDDVGKKIRGIENDYLRSLNQHKRSKAFTTDMPFSFIKRDKNDKESSVEGEEIDKEYRPKKDFKTSSRTRKRKYARDSGMEEYSDEDDDNDDGDKFDRRNSRTKRTLPKEEDLQEPNSETDGPDYIVTLRPTQIRTFIIWFDSNRKNSK